MTEDDRAFLLELGEDPDDPRLVADYARMDLMLAIYAITYRGSGNETAGS